MSQKMSCPACHAHTSSVLTAYEDGADCPYCGLPAIVASQVLEARSRGADEALVERFAESERRLAEAEAAVAKLRRKLDHIRDELED